MTFNPAASEAAREAAYEAGDIKPLINALKAQRPEIVELLTHAVDWTRTGMWLGEGRRSLKQLAEALAAHDQTHIEQIQALKAQAGVTAAS